MRKHAEQMRPKFEAVLEVLNTELGGLGIGSWYAPRGGYFISFDAMEGCAKEIVAKCKEAGVKLTNAGATFPYGKDPKDSNIRIAPSFPTPEEMAQAADLFVLCDKTGKRREASCKIITEIDIIKGRSHKEGFA